MDSRKDPHDRGGEIIDNAACCECEGGACSWHENTPAQSDEEGVSKEKET